MLKEILVVGVLLYAAVALFAWLVSDRMIFLPPPASYDERSLPVVRVPTTDGASIAVLHLPNPRADFTLLFSHGNAEDLGHLLPLLAQLRQAGFAVLAYDYRGYGLSTGGGAPTTPGAYRDEAAVYRYATMDLRIPPSRLIVHGRSVGTGPAIALASREPVAGLVVESGFVSAYRVLTGWPLLPFDKFPNLRRIRQLRCPLLVIHGQDDAIIPVWHGQRLFAAAPAPKWAYWVDQAGHNDLSDVAGERYLQALQDFARQLEETTTP